MATIPTTTRSEDLQAPAFGEGRNTRDSDQALVHSPARDDSPIGPIWDRAISYTAIGLGLCGCLLGVSSLADSQDSTMAWFTLGSFGYIAGGLVNLKLSSWWRRENLDWRLRVLVALLKPVVIASLILAVVTAFILFFCGLALWLEHERGA